MPTAVTTQHAMDTSRRSLIDLFGPSLAQQEDCLNECSSLLRLYSLTPQDLYYKFEAYALSSLAPSALSDPSLQDFRDLRAHLQSSLDASTAASLAAQTPQRNVTGGWGSAAGGTSTVKKRGGMAGMGKLFGAPGSASASSSVRAGTTFSASPSMQTPVRTGAMARGSGARPGGAFSSHAGDDSMEVDDSPSRRAARSGRDLNGSSEGGWRVQQTLNANAVPPASSSEVKATTSRVKMMHSRAPQSFPQRYMFERGPERGTALDDHLETMSSLIVEAYGLKEEDLADPSLIHQESVYVVGRICPNLTANKTSTAKDASNTGAPRLQPTNTGIMIESSKLQGAGQRVPIFLTEGCFVRRPPGSEDEEDDLGPVDVLGMFPGMIVGLKGRNGGGTGFGVDEVLLLPSLPLAATPPSQILESQYGRDQLNGGPLSIVVASGPYTAETDLDFRPWHALMDKLERLSPHVVILMGPFIPISHPKLAFSEHMPTDLFKHHFSSRLNALSPSSSARTACVLVPSVNDSLTAHAAWPQPAYDRSELGISKGVRTLPNPAGFSISGIVFGASTADVLRDLRSEEVARRVKKRQPLKPLNQSGSASSQGQGQKEDVIARAIRHVLSQRNFYPLFPPPMPKSSTTNEAAAAAAAPLPLSLPSFHLSTFTNVTPDILLLPSESIAFSSSLNEEGNSNTASVAPFAKIIDGTIVINPGSLCTSHSVNLAHLTIRPMERDQLEAEVVASASAAGQDLDGEAEGEGDEPREHEVWKRTRVELVSLGI